VSLRCLFLPQEDVADEDGEGDHCKGPDGEEKSARPERNTEATSLEETDSGADVESFSAVADIEESLIVSHLPKEIIKPAD
jgi:hypothetical protein